MYYKKIFYFILFLLTINCVSNNTLNNKIDINIKNQFANKGFALIYNDQLFRDEIISKKMDSRSLVIFQKNLKKGIDVKITNILNNKSLIVRVGNNASYPHFNNSVISPRVAEELGLDIKEPYVQIISIPKNSMFIAKKAKTFDEEKRVANTAPVDNISINNLKKKTKPKKINDKKFFYSIKIADFYFNKTAVQMINRIKKETNIIKPKIKKISDRKYRVYVGPFSNINSLQKSFNDIHILEFENIEFIKND